MSILLDNKILEAAEQKLEAGLRPEQRDNYMKIVVAGMKVAMNGGPNSILAQLKQSKDPVNDAAVGAINLVLLLRHQSARSPQTTMPLDVMVPAAMTLMLHALDFADRTGVVKVGNNELVRATHIFTDHIFAAFKITQPMLNKLAQQVHGITQDPAKMAAIKKNTANPPAGAPPAQAPAQQPAAAGGGGMINGV